MNEKFSAFIAENGAIPFRIVETLDVSLFDGRDS